MSLSSPAQILRRPARAGLPARLRTARDERGLSTAEYAVGTLGACSIAGILLKIAGSDWFMDLIKAVISQAFKVLL